MVRDIKNVKPDLDAQLNEAFNSMIGDVLADLATEANSPVFTGFLASSWRAQKSQVRQKDRREDFEPWASIKREHDLPKGSEGWKPAGSRPDNPVIDPRFPVGTDYKFRKANIYIGNAAEYAGYAAENPIISQFVQGEAGTIIKDNMRDKGKIFVGAKPSSGFGKIKRGSGLRYIEPS